MNTYGGDWTLVWSYSFTNYTHLNDGSNASGKSLRKQLGRQVLIKSNINKWLVSHPGPGSLVFGGKVISTVRSSNTWLAQVTSLSHRGFHRIKTIAMGRCFAWPNAITALTIILMVTLKTIGLPMILSEEIVLTKRKMLQIHMVTFSFESSRKERLWQISTQINSEVINFFSQYQYHIHQKSY